jgi:hypothetical protein
MHVNYHQFLRAILFAVVLSLTITACGGTPEPTPTPEPPTVELVALPPSMQAGVAYPVKADIDGTYTDVEFSTDNGGIEPSVSDEIVYWTPVDSDKLASIKVEVFYYGSADPVEDSAAVIVEEAPAPVCPSDLTVITPVSDSDIEHNLQVRGSATDLEDGTSLRLATWPYVTNNYHPQDAKPDGESWTVTVFAGQQGPASAGEKFDLVVLAVNAAGDFRMDKYLSKAKATGKYTGMSAIEGATECLRIENLTRK